MEALKLDKKTAREIYDFVPDWFKKTLESTFDKKELTGSILDRATTFEKCYELSTIAARVIYHNTVNDNTPQHIRAYAQLELIISVIREGFIPDYSNKSQKKWHPVFDLSSGCRFSRTACTYTITFTFVGSRLCLDTEEKVLFMVKYYLDLYTQLLTYNN